jgi:hypothetical protein
VSRSLLMGIGVAMSQSRKNSPNAEDQDAQVSQGPSSLTPAEPLGGADAVPETPDNVPADQLNDTERGTASTTG